MREGERDLSGVGERGGALFGGPTTRMQYSLKAKIVYRGVRTGLYQRWNARFHAFLLD